MPHLGVEQNAAAAASAPLPLACLIAALLYPASDDPAGQSALPAAPPPPPSSFLMTAWQLKAWQCGNVAPGEAEGGSSTCDATMNFALLSLSASGLLQVTTTSQTEAGGRRPGLGETRKRSRLACRVLIL